MSTANEINQTRIINELRQFIKKLLQDPAIVPAALDVARKHYGTQEARVAMAQEISSLTSVKIPDDPEDFSDADRLFLEVLKEVMDEEQAMN